MMVPTFVTFLSLPAVLDATVFVGVVLNTTVLLYLPVHFNTIDILLTLNSIRYHRKNAGLTKKVPSKSSLTFLS